MSDANSWIKPRAPSLPWEKMDRRRRIENPWGKPTADFIASGLLRRRSCMASDKRFLADLVAAEKLLEAVADTWILLKGRGTLGCLTPLFGSRQAAWDIVC
jgi:hypothetical protein